LTAPAGYGRAEPLYPFAGPLDPSAAMLSLVLRLPSSFAGRLSLFVRPRCPFARVPDAITERARPNARTPCRLVLVLATPRQRRGRTVERRCVLRAAGHEDPRPLRKEHEQLASLPVRL
jgi:hypothetical protein